MSPNQPPVNSKDQVRSDIDPNANRDERHPTAVDDPLTTEGEAQEVPDFKDQCRSVEGPPNEEKQAPSKPPKPIQRDAHRGPDFKDQCCFVAGPRQNEPPARNPSATASNTATPIIPFAVAVPEYIKQINHGRTGDPAPCSWLPDNPELVGRTSELEKLRSAVTAGTMTALLGMAGVGKSHTAKRFAWSWVSETDANKTRFALWLSSETEASIRLGYDRVMEQLNIKPNTDEGSLATSEMARRVWDELRQSPFEWLVVFDNAPEAANGVEGPQWIQPWFFPTPITGWGSGGRILFTTRSNSYRGQTCLGRVSPIRVNPLNETDGVDLLLRDIMDDGASEALFAESREAAKELVTTHFDGLSLAIAVASGQIIDMQSTVKAYLDDLRLGKMVGGVHDKMLLALKSALAHARNTGLGGVLDIAAFINPDSISLKLLGGDRDAVGRLCKLNLLRLVETNVYSMHRLLQKAARNGCSPSAAVNALWGVLSSFEPSNLDTWDLGGKHLPHVEALEKVVKQNGGIGFLDQDEVRKRYASIIRARGYVLYHFGNFREARLKYNEALEMQYHVYGANARNADLAWTLSGLGELCRVLGKCDEALVNYKEALEMQYLVYGANAKNSVLACTLDDLGRLYHTLGKHDEARVKFEEALEMQWHAYGAKNAGLARTLNNIGDHYRVVGKYKEARVMYEEALEMQWHVHGANAKNADLARTFNSIGDLYSIVGKYDEARVKYEEALEMQWHVYGANAKNVGLARTLNSLGNLYRMLGQYDEARVKLEEALEMQRHVYGVDVKNADLSSTLCNLGLLYKDIGEPHIVHGEEASSFVSSTDSSIIPNNF